MTSWITRLISRQLSLLLENITSVLEGALITLEFWIAGLVLGPAWAINEIWMSRMWDVKAGAMLDKIKSLFALFRVGEEVANAEKWKAGQIQATLVAGFILAVVNVAKAFDHPLPVDADSANAIGAGVIAVANILLSGINSSRSGLLPPKADNTPGPADSGQSTAVHNPWPVDAPIQKQLFPAADDKAARDAADQYRA